PGQPPGGARPPLSGVKMSNLECHFIGCFVLLGSARSPRPGVARAYSWMSAHRGSHWWPRHCQPWPPPIRMPGRSLNLHGVHEPGTRSGRSANRATDLNTELRARRMPPCRAALAEVSTAAPAQPGAPALAAAVASIADPTDALPRP